jgi:hypothetical protein
VPVTHSKAGWNPILRLSLIQPHCIKKPVLAEADWLFSVYLLLSMGALHLSNINRFTVSGSIPLSPRPPSPFTLFILRGRILGQNTDKSLQSFFPCYSQSPLQLWLEISIFSNSRNLLQFLEFSNCTLSRRKEKNLIENHTPSLWFKKSLQKPQVWELSRLCPETSTKLYVHEFDYSSGKFLRINIRIGLYLFQSLVSSLSRRTYQNPKQIRPWIIFQDTCRTEHLEKTSHATVPFSAEYWVYCTGSPTQTNSGDRCLMRPWDQLSFVCTVLYIFSPISTRLSSKIRKLRKLAPRHKILTGGTTEAGVRRKLVQPGVLPSLAGGECPGSRDLHWDGHLDSPYRLPQRTVPNALAKAALLRANPTKPTDPCYFTCPKESAVSLAGCAQRGWRLEHWGRPAPCPEVEITEKQIHMKAYRIFTDFSLKGLAYEFLSQSSGFFFSNHNIAISLKLLVCSEILKSKGRLGFSSISLHYKIFQGDRWLSW